MQPDSGNLSSQEAPHRRLPTPSQQLPRIGAIVKLGRRRKMLDLFDHWLIGDITRRVAMAILAYRTFTRSISLPGLKPKEVAGAVQLRPNSISCAPGRTFIISGLQRHQGRQGCYRSVRRGRTP